MVELSDQAYTIIYFVKTIIINLYMYYAFNKIIHINKNKVKEIIMFLAFNVLLSVLHTYVDTITESALALIMVYMLFGIFMGAITKNKIGYSLVITALSYAICNIALLMSVMINFIPYNLIYKGNYYLNTASVLLLQFAFVYAFFKIKKFKNGFAFLNKKLNSDTTDAVVSYAGVAVILITAIMSTLNHGYKTATQDLVFTLIILGITMFMMIQKTLTMHYKQTQMLKALDEYKNEILEKDKEIQKLSKEKFNTSKIRHEFYNRQKALELLVKQNIVSENNIEKDGVSQNILDIITSLTDEYSEECNRIKELPELDKTDIVEIDSMFKYMQNECAKNNIEFKLKVIGNIHPLVNNIITKSRLETLIGDHLKDAINAINNDNVVNKEIFAILGKKDKKYELTIHDTGVEFKIDTLLKLGKEATTTCADKGGSGIGFLTTFETLEQTKASLIITENKPTNERYYTKSITIRFDGKHEYRIYSYRAEEMKKYNDDSSIIVKNIK